MQRYSHSQQHSYHHRHRYCRYPPPCAPTDDDAFKNDGDNPSKDVEDDAKLEEFDDEDNSKHADVYRRINASAIE